VIRGFERLPSGGLVMARGFLLAVTVSFVMLSLSPAAARAFVYWNSPGTMSRANLDASGVSDPLFSGTDQSSFGGLAVGGGYIYWTADQAVGRATIDGCGTNPAFIPVSEPSGVHLIDVAVDAGHLYWTNGGTSIGRANLDGSGVNESFLAGYQPITVAVDANYVYWSNDHAGVESIGRANLDGSGANPDFIPLSAPAGRIALDAGHIYWVNESAHAIGRANLNGTGKNEAFVPTTATGTITGIAVDANYVYWSHDLDAIGRATVTGTGVTPSFITSSNGVGGMTVDALGPGAEFCAAPSAVAFASRVAGSGASASQTVTITNGGAAALHVSAVALGGADASQFALVTDDCAGATVASGGGSCTVTVAFDPTTTGMQTASVHFTDDASSRPTDVSLAGNGTPATIAPPAGNGPPAATTRQLPKNTAPPAISGIAGAHHTLACSQGSWSGSPTGFSYQWSRDGTPIQGATADTYAVQSSDEGLTLTCAVTASNSAGTGSAATSQGVVVTIPHVAHCPGATGTLSRQTLGLARLGMTRTQAHHRYSHSSNRGKRYQDFFCLTPIGVRVGYASPQLLKTLPRGARTRLRNRVIWIDTANGSYSLNGIRPGATVAAASAALKVGAAFHIGLNSWYFAPDGSSTALLKVRGDIVNEIGIAYKRITQGRKAQLAFITSFA
jgi:hypothetical protein